MKLGKQVLAKIQNLLAQIGQSKSPTPVPTKRKKQQQPLRQKCQNQNNVYTKLHQLHKARKAKHEFKQNQKILKQQSQMSPFKITNTHTIFLNQQNKQRPIHERLYQIKQKQYQQRQRLRQKYPTRQDLIRYDQDQQLIQMQYRRRNQRKYTKKQLQQKMRQMDNKQRIRLQKLNKLKLKAIQQHSKEFRCRPYVGKQSQNVWNRYKLKKDLSNSVFQRFQQYQIDRKIHLETREKEIKEQIMPFAPKISQNSRLIASRSASKSDLHKKMTKSMSFKCFKGKYTMGKDMTLTSSRIF